MIIVFIILGWIVNLFTPKCIVDGCDSEQMEGSSYCYYHKNSAYYKSYSRGTSSYSNSTHKYNSSNSSSDSYSSSKNTSSYNTDSKSSDTSLTAKKSYSHTSDKDDDMYDASSYSDAEDFYYDNYDDFCDYEEAEE